MQGTFDNHLVTILKECIFSVCIKDSLVCVINYRLYIFQIEIGFLMVGHTHEDVDQRFSRLSQYLMKHSATTMEGLCELYNM